MAKKGTYNHAEAFCLMWYKCEKCGHEMRIWNSRDGVTPFIIACPACRMGEAKHIDWGRDQPYPDFIPPQGHLVFIDFPQSLKRVTAHKRVLSFDGTEFELLGQERADMIESLAKGIADYEPFLIRVP